MTRWQFYLLAAIVGWFAHDGAHGQTIHMSAGTVPLTDKNGTQWTPNTCTGWIPFSNPGTYPYPIYNNLAYTQTAGSPITCPFTIPTGPASYSIVVHLIEPIVTFVRQSRVFDVWANGNPIKTGVDIWQLAGGIKTPTDISGTVLANGTLTVTFTQTKSSAIFAGIEIYPAGPVQPPPELPPQTGTPGYLYSNGSTAVWGNILTSWSGALDGSSVPGQLDIVTAVVPLKGSANAFAGFNSFSMFQWIPNTISMTCAAPGDSGKAWFDNTDPNNQVFRICLTLGGVTQWVAK